MKSNVMQLIDLIEIWQYIMIGCNTNGEFFGGGPVQDTHHGSLFHFHQHRRVRHFGKFISISHTVGEMTKADKIIKALGAIRRTSGPIWKS